MRIFTYILSVIAIALIIYNLTLVDFEAPFTGDNMIAVITIICGLCAVVLLALIRMSRRLEKHVKRKK
jgi:hypothetical protein